MKDRTEYFREYVQRPGVKAQRRANQRAYAVRQTERERHARSVSSARARFKRKLKDAGLALGVIENEMVLFNQRMAQQS